MGHKELLERSHTGLSGQHRPRDQDPVAAFFLQNPLPLWIFDLETLRFLAVNDVALRNYGYERDEFLAMTIRDIRPTEDVPRVDVFMSKMASGARNAGVWRHRKKDGTVISVEIFSQ